MKKLFIVLDTGKGAMKLTPEKLYELPTGDYSKDILDIKQQLQNLIYPDIVLHQSDIVIVNNIIDLPVNAFSWRINNIVSDDVQGLYLPISNTPIGKSRYLTLQGSEDGNYSLNYGDIQNTGSGLLKPPTIPSGFIELKTFLVIESNISEVIPTIPQESKRLEKYKTLYNGTNTILPYSTSDADVVNVFVNTTTVEDNYSIVNGNELVLPLSYLQEQVIQYEGTPDETIVEASSIYIVYYTTDVVITEPTERQSFMSPYFDEYFN